MICSLRLAPLNLPRPTVAGVEEAAAEKGDASKEDSEEQTLGQLMKRCNKAREELYSLLANPVVVDITRIKVEKNCITFDLKYLIKQGGVMNGRSMQDINARKMRETSLRREVCHTFKPDFLHFSSWQVEQLQLAMLKLETNKPGRRFTFFSCLHQMLDLLIAGPTHPLGHLQAGTLLKCSTTRSVIPSQRINNSKFFPGSKTLWSV